MRLVSIKKWLMSVGLMVSVTLIPQTVPAQEPITFFCAKAYRERTNEEYYATYAQKNNKTIQLIRWRYSWFDNSNLTPHERCKQVSKRFDEAYKNGSLNYITNDIIKEQSVICTARKNEETCVTVLLTLRPSDNPIQVANQLKEVLRGRASVPITHNSDHPKVYYQININRLFN